MNPDDEHSRVLKLSCPEACVKFDGYATTDNKRVLYRGCHVPNLNLETDNYCKDDYEWHGAVGRMCTCNAALCNGAEETRGVIGVVGLVTAAVAGALIQAVVYRP